MLRKTRRAGYRCTLANKTPFLVTGVKSLAQLPLQLMGIVPNPSELQNPRNYRSLVLTVSIGAWGAGKLKEKSITGW